MALIVVAGGGAMTLLGNVLGNHAEAAALALIGVGLFGTSQVLHAQPKRLAEKPLSPPPLATTKPSEAQ